MVFTINHFAERCPKRALSGIRVIEGAAGQTFPYSGLIKSTFHVSGLNIPVACVLLVVSDTKYNKNVPVILALVGS